MPQLLGSLLPSMASSAPAFASTLAVSTSLPISVPPLTRPQLSSTPVSRCKSRNVCIVVGPLSLSPSIPALTHRKPQYRIISIVFAKGWPRSGKVVTMPMLPRKSFVATAVLISASALCGEVSAMAASAIHARIAPESALVVRVVENAIPMPLVYRYEQRRHADRLRVALLPATIIGQPVISRHDAELCRNQIAGM
jgi:hypothetical protein